MLKPGIANFLVVVIVFGLFLSCSPNWHLKRAVKKGINADSITVIEHDTVRFSSVRDSMIYNVQEVDTAAILSLCKGILSQTPSTVRNIQKVACKPFQFDSTYQVMAMVQGKKYNLPVTVHIFADAQHREIIIDIPELKLPYIKEETKVNIECEQRIPWWIWVIIGALAVMLFISFFRRF